MGLERIHISRHIGEAHLLCDLLKDHGIAATLLGAPLADMGTGAPPELWVRQQDAARAIRIIQQWAHTGKSPRAPRRRPWQCPACLEMIEGHFTACWSCQTPRPADGAGEPPPLVQASSGDDPTLQTDLPCQRCGYDLRGLTAERRCPECGLPVLRSMLDAMRDDAPAEADELDRVLRQTFQAAAKTLGYPASLIILICHAWLELHGPLADPQAPPQDAAPEKSEQVPPRQAPSAIVMCQAVVRCAITYFGGVNEARRGLRAWGLKDARDIDRVLAGLIDARLIDCPKSHAPAPPGSSLDLDQLFHTWQG